MNFRLSIIFIVACFFVSCVPADEISTSTPVDGGTSTSTVVISGGDSTEISTPSPESIVDSTPASPTAYPTRDSTGLDWQAVPIMPELSERVYQIYKVGQELGRDPSHFSVIGDCQSIPYVFLGPYGRGELEPDSAESYLWDAIDYFRPSIDRWGVASRGGFTVASLLAPIQADPLFCKPGETPLTCEYRLNNPAYVFITLELWDNPDTIERYEVYLRGILDYVIEQGSIPILLTKADAAEVDDGSHVINPAIVRIAYEYDVPLVNFWRAAQYLENIGLDPDRDGFHLSQDGYDLKNTLALRALYTIWQAVKARGAEDGFEYSEGTSTPTFTLTEFSPPELLIPAPDCSGDCLFFSTVISRDGSVSSQGVYIYNYSKKILSKLIGDDYDLQDVSEDGSRLLINQANYLYEFDLRDSSSSLLSNTFFYLGKQGAYWNSDDSEVIFIDQADPILTETGSAYTLYPSNRDGEIYFEAGSCASKDFCQSGGVYRLTSDLALTSMDSYDHPIFSPHGGWMAFLNPAAAVKDNYYHIWYLLLEDPGFSATTRRTIYFPDETGFLIFPEVREFEFSPGNDKLMIIYDAYSEQFERSEKLQTYMMDLNTGILYDFGKMAGSSASLNPHLVWSPDGTKVLFFLAQAPTGGDISMSIFQTDLITGEKLALFDEAILTNSDYFYLTNIYWR